MQLNPYRLLALALLAGLCAFGPSARAQSANPAYNKSLADSLGGDDYGMKRYVLVLLKTGTNQTAGKAATDSLFRGHMQNINHLAETGRLVVAGPLQKNDKTYRGIFILNVKTFEEAQRLLQQDPAIRARLLDAELYSWYGSAALPLYLPYHNQVEKVKM